MRLSESSGSPAPGGGVLSGTGWLLMEGLWYSDTLSRTPERAATAATNTSSPAELYAADPSGRLRSLPRQHAYPNLHQSIVLPLLPRVSRGQLHARTSGRRHELRAEIFY
jgi:hypothetical protein